MTITSFTPTVSGWNGKQSLAHDNGNNAVWTSDGYSVTTNYNSTIIGGFSVTSGAGNYGYYQIDCGCPQSELSIDVDMYIFCNSDGAGLWTIMASSSGLDNNQFTSDAVQVWCSHQYLSNGMILTQIQGGGWITRIKQVFTITNNFQYIFIGGIDLGQGAVGISLTSVKALTS